MDKDNLIKILNLWNYWDKEVSNLNHRTSYENSISLFRQSREVIVLKGIRRSGKSTLLNLEIKNLLEQGINKENILFINFEEPNFINNLDISFLDFIYETYLEYLKPKGKVYIFLDEIQNIKVWEKWVLRMYEKSDVQLYVTGSSSKLLSSEFSTALSGRHLSLDIMPLSFKEFLDFNNIKYDKKMDLISNQIRIKSLFNEYLNWGGFPKILELKEDLLKKQELISYYDTIILKDIGRRYEISNIEDLRKLSFYFISNLSKLYSVNKLKNLNLGAYDTLKKYISYLKETYLLFDLQLFDFSVKKQMINLNKMYVIDTGLANAIGFKFSEDKGRLLENLVFIELKRRGKEIYYHKQKKECDFVIKEGLDIVQAIQVTKSLEDIDTKKREIAGLLDACKAYKLKTGLILTQDEEYEVEQEGVKIQVLPVWKWLLIENQ